CTCIRLCFIMVQRHLRSTLFPTRRSSDLGRGHVSHRVDRIDAVAHLEMKLRRIDRAGLADLGDGLAAPHPRVLVHQQPAVMGIRSEEHTSELQSRENLVCRLLLEKKKKTQ